MYTVKKVRDLPDMKKNSTLVELKTDIRFDPGILNQGLVCILEKELDMTDRALSAFALRKIKIKKY